MSNENNIYNIFNNIFGEKVAFSDSDIISMYIDGKISKEEYIRRMDSRRKNENRF